MIPMFRWKAAFRQVDRFWAEFAAFLLMWNVGIAVGLALLFKHVG